MRPVAEWPLRRLPAPAQRHVLFARHIEFISEMIDELDGALLPAELYHRPLGTHLIAPAILGDPKIARVFHGQIVGREFDLTEVEPSRANLPGAVEGKEVGGRSPQRHHRQGDAQRPHQQAMPPGAAEGAGTIQEGLRGRPKACRPVSAAHFKCYGHG